MMAQRINLLRLKSSLLQLELDSLGLLSLFLVFDLILDFEAEASFVLTLEALVSTDSTSSFLDFAEDFLVSDLVLDFETGAS